MVPSRPRLRVLLNGNSGRRTDTSSEVAAKGDTGALSERRAWSFVLSGNSGRRTDTSSGVAAKGGTGPLAERRAAALACCQEPL